MAGFTFLIYEVSWNRLLSLILGTTVVAATIVLAAFMAGFGLGAYYWGRRANAMRRIGPLLASLLGGTGILGLLSYILITNLLPHLYAILANQGLSLELIEVCVFGISAGILFCPAFLMGGIFPLISKMATRSGGSIASTLGGLYALETLGSTLGGLLAGFLLLGLLGQRNTIALAVIIDLGLAAWLLSMRGIDQVVSEKRFQRSPAAPAARQKSALAGTFLCGFAILSLQVFWMRMLRIHLTNTSYTFALVSSLVILGLFVGSLLFKRKGRDSDDHDRSLSQIILLMGASTGLGLLLLVYLPQVLMFPFESVLIHPLMRVLVLPMVASLLIVFPPAIFSGYAFPLACRMYAAGRESISRDVGIVLMVNTIGAVIGPVVATFILMPLLGVARAVLLVVLLLAAGALYILRGRKGRISRGAAYAGIAITLFLIIFQPNIRILPPSFARFDREVLFYRESVEGTLSVGQDRGGGTSTKYTFVNNSTVIGSTYDAVKVVKMVGHLPFFLGLDCKDALVIGFGIGVTTSAIASHPEVESIECVELVAGMGTAARYYRDLNHNVIEDPRLKLITGDGRHYLQLTPKKYDLISCDPTHPILGSGNLYTQEYFALCRAHLNAGGMVSQYLPLHKLRPEDFLGIIGTFHSAFPHATVWLGHYHAVMLGSMDPIHIDFVEWANRVAEIGKDAHFYSDPYHLAATLMLDGATIAELTRTNRFNTDDRSYTEFFAPANLAPENLAKNLALFMEQRTEIGNVFGNIADPAQMARFVEGNRLLTESLYHRMSGDNERSLAALRRATQINPEDQEFPFLIRLYFSQ